MLRESQLVYGVNEAQTTRESTKPKSQFRGDFLWNNARNVKMTVHAENVWNASWKKQNKPMKTKN